MFVLECIALPGKLCQRLCVYNIHVVFGVCLSLKSITKSKHWFVMGSTGHWEILFDLATCH